MVQDWFGGDHCHFGFEGLCGIVRGKGAIAQGLLSKFQTRNARRHGLVVLDLDGLSCGLVATLWKQYLCGSILIGRHLVEFGTLVTDALAKYNFSHWPDVFPSRIQIKYKIMEKRVKERIQFTTNKEWKICGRNTTIHAMQFNTHLFPLNQARG